MKTLPKRCYLAVIAIIAATTMPGLETLVAVARGEATSTSANQPRDDAPQAPEGRPTVVVDMSPHIRVPDGFTIERVAGPPLVNRPISADFDEQGRLYVTDSSGSNEDVHLQLTERPHRIVRLEDINGDGHFDNSTVFADKMMFPEGAMWHDGSLYVAAPPHIWKLTDLDDDGVADHREVWYDGKTLERCANDLHGPYLGLDGWVYWCKGAFEEQTHARPGKPPLVTRAAHIFRRHPDGGPVEAVMTGGMNNPVDVAFTAGGERILTGTFFVHPGGGQRDGLIHAVYGGVYGKQHGVLDGHPRTGELMPVLEHLGVAAPCGATRLETAELGEGFRHSLLACQFNVHKVSRHVLAPRDATFIAQTEDLVSCDHVDFHPTDVLEDADGSVLVVDTGGWYMICCPTSQEEKPEVLGGIYRLRRTGSHQTSDPRGLAIPWSKLDAQQLAARLADPRPAVRRRAQDTLVAEGAAAVPALVRTMEAPSSPEQSLHAVWTLTRIDDPSARAAVRASLTSDDENVRQAALHSVAVWKDQLALEQLTAALRDDSIHNRRVAAEAMGRLGLPEGVGPLLSAAADYRGRVLEHSLIYALIEIGDVEAVRVGLNTDNPYKRRAALVALENLAPESLEGQRVVGLVESDQTVLADTAWWIVKRHPDWAAEMASHFRQKLADPQLSRKALAPLANNIVRFSAAPEVQKIVATALDDYSVSRTAKLAILDALAVSPQTELPESWTEPLGHLLATDDAEVLGKAVRVVHAHKHAPAEPRLVDGLRKAADNESLPIEVRLGALAAGGAGESVDGDLLQSLLDELSSNRPVRNRSLAVDVLLDVNLTDDQLVRLSARLPETAAMELPRLLGVFARSSSNVVGRALITALEQSPAATALDASAVHDALSRFAPSVRQQAGPLLVEIEAASGQKLERLEAVLTLLDQGDVRRGQDVFYGTKAACSACHAIGYRGGKIGPDLTTIGRIRNERTLLESILFPSATLVQSYEPEVIRTHGGKTYAGVVQEETPREVVLAVDAEKTVRIARDEIEHRAPGEVSIMPDGLDKQLTPQQLADLIVYLRSAQ